MKAPLIIIVIIITFFVANRIYLKASHRGSRAPASLGSTQTIEYKNSDDLLTKLKQVRTGQKIDLKCTGSNTEVVATGYKCGTPEAQAASSRIQAEHKRKTTEINQELKRIQQLP